MALIARLRRTGRGDCSHDGDCSRTGKRPAPGATGKSLPEGTLAHAAAGRLARDDLLAAQAVDTRSDSDELAGFLLQCDLLHLWTRAYAVSAGGQPAGIVVSATAGVRELCRTADPGSFFRLHRTPADDQRDVRSIRHVADYRCHQFPAQRCERDRPGNLVFDYFLHSVVGSELRILDRQ